MPIGEAAPVVADAWETPLAALRDLCALSAPSGHEDRMTTAVAAYAAERGWSVAVDRLGQVLISVGPNSAAASIMLVAHMDEVGLVVRAIDDAGWIRVHRLGGIPERILPALRVVVHTRAGDLGGQVGSKSHHLTQPAEKYVALSTRDLYVDAGFTSKAAAVAAGVRVGDPVTYAPSWATYPDGRCSGKSLDNRAGVTAMLRAVHMLQENPPPVRTHVVFSCLEEFNLQGPLTMARRLEPDMALVVDIVPATDTPDLQGDGATALGAGPSLSRLAFHGRGTLGGLIPHPTMVDAVEQAASRTDTALQYDAVVGCLNDSAYLPAATARGIATASLNIPCRYTHSPSEMIEQSDMVAAATILADVARHASDMRLDRGVRRG